MLTKEKEVLKQRFKMTDMGEVKWFICMKIIDTKECIYVTQTAYIEKVLKRFNLTYASPKGVPLAKGIDFQKLMDPDKTNPKKDCPYHELEGFLLYLSVCTRPDILLAMSQLSR